MWIAKEWEEFVFSSRLSNRKKYCSCNKELHGNNTTYNVALQRIGIVWYINTRWKKQNCNWCSLSMLSYRCMNFSSCCSISLVGSKAPDAKLCEFQRFSVMHMFRKNQRSFNLTCGGKMFHFYWERYEKLSNIRSWNQLTKGEKIFTIKTEVIAKIKSKKLNYTKDNAL